MNRLRFGRGALLMIGALFALLLFFRAPAVPARADASFLIGQYDVEMVVSPDRSVQVKERISVSFTGYSSHGIIRDLPLEKGLRYRDIKAYCDNEDFSPYAKTEDGFLSLYLRGEGIVQGKERTYTLTYIMLVPALEEDGYLSLDIIGFGTMGRIDGVTAKITVPDGLKEFAVYSGTRGSTTNADGVELKRDGNVFTLSSGLLFDGHGITLDMRFAEGTLTEAADDSVFWAVGLSAGLLLLALLVKFLLCRSPLMTKTVNLDAPEGMDPLLMGKLIDNAVDSEDLGALVFYLTDRGYLTIDFSDEDDPTLIETGKSPREEPAHIQIFYEGLFGNRKRVKVSDLTNVFYKTSQATVASVETQAGKVYSGRSRLLLGLVAVIAAVLPGVFLYFYTQAKVFPVRVGWIMFVLGAVSAGISAFASGMAKQRELKWKPLKRVMTLLLGFVLSLLPALISLLIPSPAVIPAVGVILLVGSSLTGVVAGQFLTRTKKHCVRLGQIMGFKQFIEFTERDKIEFMLKENPELYYHILPYAQVLGVTDAWTEKFEGLSMQPPAYVRTGSYDVLDVLAWNHLFRITTSNLSRTLVSRPSASGGGGFHGGGFGGGFGGGGFGGGGVRGC